MSDVVAQGMLFKYSIDYHLQAIAILSLRGRNIVAKDCVQGSQGTNVDASRIGITR